MVNWPRIGRVLLPLVAAGIMAMGLVAAPFSLPILTPDRYVEYARSLGLEGKIKNTETKDSGELPQFFADRFGWPEEVAEVTRIVAGLGTEDRRQAVIFTSNYGEASALLFLGEPWLPPVISPHNNYWIWGTQGSDGEAVILITDASIDELNTRYETCDKVGRMANRYAMPYETKDIVLCRHRRMSLKADWPKLKSFN
jgi:hypothetical protein